jgi:hypothetical protein
MAAKTAADLSGLVATKGQAAPVANVPARSAAPAEDAEANNVPLNFRVSADLRRRFRVFAANNDLKLNELLRLAFDEYEKRHGH